MKHMRLDDRNRLEFLAACGRSASQMAEDRGRSPSAIREEFIRHRISSDKGYGCSNRVCAHFDVCQLHKKFYIASAAQAAYESLRSLSRTGVRPDDETIRKMNEILSPSVRNGQSVTAIVRANAETFKGFAPSTVYEWLEDGFFSAGIELDLDVDVLLLAVHDEDALVGLGERKDIHAHLALEHVLIHVLEGDRLSRRGISPARMGARRAGYGGVRTSPPGSRRR